MVSTANPKMPTILEMAQRIKADTPSMAHLTDEQALDLLTPRGELCFLMWEYLDRYWREVLPTERKRPAKGDLCQRNGRVEVWTGKEWQPSTWGLNG